MNILCLLEIITGISPTIKSDFKALGLYNFKRGFGWAYKRGGGLYPGGLISRIKKCFGTMI